MANKASKRGKKPIETTLGKAPSNEKEIDLSQIRKPIDTSILGIEQVISLLKTATAEVKNYVSFECDILYECRVCRSIFRSLANFILHKRNYCKERFNPLNDSESSENFEEPIRKLRDRLTKPVECKSKTLNPVIDKLVEKQQVTELAQEALTEDLSLTGDKKEDNERETGKCHDVFLEKIESSNAAVFQTLLDSLNCDKPNLHPDLMKSEVLEIHNIQDNEGVVLGPDGKVCSYESHRLYRNCFNCIECNLPFSTRKTLTYHIKCKHNESRLMYVCPNCKEMYATPWGVYRHLLKVHRMTNKQIRKLRDQIHNNVVRNDPELFKNEGNEEEKEIPDEENQWLNNFEKDNDLQMCGGCGKRFERKAALHSHSQMCAKRIAVFNTIKENNAKKKDEECSSFRNTASKSGKSVPQRGKLKGASKRKAITLKICEVKSEQLCSNTQDVMNNEEKMDTQKVFNIIGVPISYHNQCGETGGSSKEEVISIKEEKNVIGSDDGRIHSGSESSDVIIVSDGGSKKKQYGKIKIKSDDDLMIPTAEFIKIESGKSKQEDSIITNSEANFEVFYKNIGDRVNDPIVNIDLTEDYEFEPVAEKKYKTIPSNVGKLNSQEKQNMHIDDEDDDVIFIGEDKIITTELSSSSTSNFSNNIEDQKETRQSLSNSENGFVGFSNDEQSDNNINHFFVTCSVTVPESTRCNKTKSPKKLLKRKRGVSLDERLQTPLKTAKKFNSRDETFISKAAPYMDQGKLLCIPCNILYNSLSDLLWHMSAHFSWFRFQCSRCSFVSFNKSGCILHAKEDHNLSKESISNVILRIPNWKTVLMSHDFCSLQDTDLSRGKHTDEVMLDNSEEYLSNDSDSGGKTSDSCNDSPLFSEYKNGPELLTSSSNTDEQFGCEIIDVDESSLDSQKLQMPQTIENVALNVSDIIKNAVNEHNLNNNVDPVEGDVFTKSEATDDSCEDYEFLPEIHKIDSCKSTTQPDDKIPRVDLSMVVPNEDSKKEEAEKVAKVRPARNRIKTQQDDFLYDLNRAVKLSESSGSRCNNSQKNKRLAESKK